MEGPVGRITYTGNANFYLKQKKLNKRVTKLGLIAGGAGITPLFECLDAIYRAREQVVDVKMLYSNKTEADILLREELDAINADASAPNISVTHTLTRAEGEVTGDNIVRGRVSIEMLQSLGFPAPSDETFIFTCGPSAFNKAIKEFLLAAGYTEDMILG